MGRGFRAVRQIGAPGAEGEAIGPTAATGRRQNWRERWLALVRLVLVFDLRDDVWVEQGGGVT